jgi:hypothetical protein
MRIRRFPKICDTNTTPSSWTAMPALALAFRLIG